MTKIQIKFLKAIYQEEKTAIELCKELKIKPNSNDSMGGFYNALNRSIDYLTSDNESEIEEMFETIDSRGPECNNDFYKITPKGKTYVENYNRDFKHYIIPIIIGIIVSVVIAVFQRYI